MFWELFPKRSYQDRTSYGMIASKRRSRAVRMWKNKMTRRIFLSPPRREQKERSLPLQVEEPQVVANPIKNSQG